MSLFIFLNYYLLWSKTRSNMSSTHSHHPLPVRRVHSFRRLSRHVLSARWPTSSYWRTVSSAQKMTRKTLTRRQISVSPAKQRCLCGSNGWSSEVLLSSEFVCHQFLADSNRTGPVVGLWSLRPEISFYVTL